MVFGYVYINLKKYNSKMIIGAIRITSLKNILNPFSMHPMLHYCTINQKSKKRWCDKNKAEHKQRCKSEAQYQFDNGALFPNPEKITADEWTYLFNLPSANQRRRYLQHLYGQQSISCEWKVVKVIKNEIRNVKRQATLEERKKNKHLIYAVGHNSLLLRISPQQMAKWMNLRMHRAKLFGQKLIIDCGFDDQMSDRERRETIWKLEKTFTENRTHNLPFDLYYFGGPSNNNNDCLKRLTKRIPTLNKNSSMTKIHYDKCYTECFPKNRLVMLTPDSPNILEYNFDDIYVVGGIVDKCAHDPLMLAKAKRLDIRTARLPLQYLPRERRTMYEIPLDVVVAILRERQMKNDWLKIFDQFIPKLDFLHEKSEKRRYELRQGSKILKYKE